MKILLATINARYSHASLALRYLRANLGEYREYSQICEFTLEERPADIAEKLLNKNPEVIGLGVYIWNCRETLAVVEIIKSIKPQIKIILGGPEVSHEYSQQKICNIADHTIIGYADFTFYQTVKNIFNHQSSEIPRFIAGDLLSSENLKNIILPEDEYSDKDILHRNIYVEASRGCPFKCEFCLSSLDKTAITFPLDKVLNSLQKLWQSGVRQFKFVDRTFNLKVDFSIAILDFFLEKTDEEFFVHFEMIPDRLPQELRQRLAKFPSGSLQLEIGIQTFNLQIQEKISRRQQNDKTIDNLNFLTQQTQAHLHTDLIVGLPGEDINSFAESFAKLYNLSVGEIQVGILKRLRGAPINRHINSEKLIFSQNPPYTILQTAKIDFIQMQKMVRFARFWDLIGNSGRFPESLPFVLSKNPFFNFLRLSEGIFQNAGQTYKISFERLIEYIYFVGKDFFASSEEIDKLQNLLISDYQKSGARGKINFANNNDKNIQLKTNSNITPQRQKRHLR